MHHGDQFFSIVISNFDCSNHMIKYAVHLALIIGFYASSLLLFQANELTLISTVQYSK